MTRAIHRYFVYLLLAAALPLASCGKSQETGSGGGGEGATKLLLLDTGIEEVNQNTWRAAIANFEKNNPGATVDFRPYKDDDYSQGGMLIAALTSETPPDVYFEWAWAAVARDAKNGHALDLTPFITPEFKVIIDEHSWAGTDYDGKTYMIPAAFEVANLIYYRRQTLADHGIAVPQTWEEFLEACKKLKAAGVTPIFQGNQAAWPCGNWASEIASRYLGVEGYREAGAVPPARPLTDDGFVQAVTRLAELRDAGAFNSDINTLNDNEGMAHFVSGQGAFIFAGSWVVDQLLEAGGAEAFGVFRTPKLPGEPEGNNYMLANSTGYMIHAKTKNPELAFALLEELVAPEVQRIRIEGGLNTTNAAVMKEISAPMQQAVLDELAKADEWIAAPDISWNRYTAERFYEAVKQVVGGEAEPAAALESAARDVAAATKK